MREHEPLIKTVNVSIARRNFSQLLDQVFRRETRLIVEKSGIPVAGIVSAADLERFNQFEKQRAERFKALDATREAFKDVPDEELEREVAKAVATARQKHRKATQSATKAS